MSSLFQSVPFGWKRSTLHHLADGPKNGAWGSEAGEDEVDAICVRVADFDWSHLALDLSAPTIRSFKKSQFKALQLQRGDLVIEKSGGGEKTPVGRVVSFDDEVQAVTSNFVARIRPSKSVQTRYFLYLLSAHYMSGYSHQFIKQNTGIQNLDDTNLFRSDVWIPDLPTQRAIADFLDRETARIDALIQKKQRLVELLGDSIRSVINQATTIGFNDCGTRKLEQKWLNEVAAHWRVTPLKWFTRLQSGFAFKADRFGDIGTRLVRMNNLKRGVLDLEESVCIADEDVNNSVQLREGDILFGMSGSIGETGSLGNFAVVKESDCPCLLNQRVGRFQIVSNELLSDYLLLVIQSSSFLDPIFLAATSTAQFNISPSQIGAVQFALPPIEEQRKIVNEVLIRTTKLNKVRLTTSKSIDRLKEYRSALITSAVTGQIDVTKWGKAGTADRQLDRIQEEMGV